MCKCSGLYLHVSLQFLEWNDRRDSRKETLANVAMVDADVVVNAHFDIFLEHGPSKKAFLSVDRILVLYFDL